MQTAEKLKRLESLRNIGPKCAEYLLKAGIDTPEQLKAIGAKEAYIEICLTSKQFGFNACYLYALEGAIQDCDWRAIPEEKKTEFKLFTAQLKKDLI